MSIIYTYLLILLNIFIHILGWSLQRAVKEERYRDAAFVRDYAGAGLVSLVFRG